MALTHLRRYGRLVEQAFDRNFLPVLLCLVLADFALALAVAYRVPYTEIDWNAYMQEVAGVIEDNELDYLKLRGDTGPLVYPAGFVYVFSLLYHFTQRGTDIWSAQIVFAALHAALVAVVAVIYRVFAQDARGKGGFYLPSVSILLLVCSRRILSLCVLRLFNDAVQSLLMYIAVLFFAQNKWTLGCLVFSASVSVKMNALLYAPAVLVLLCQALGPLHAVGRVVFVCGGFQLLVGAPFLWHAPAGYISKAFEFSRVFMHQWSVNFAFLTEDQFLVKSLSLGLIVSHLVLLVAFGHFRWTESSTSGILGLLGFHAASERRASWRRSFQLWWLWMRDFEQRQLRPSHVIHCLFTCNFIGIAAARTLHYQFYLWYFHTLPLLLLTSTLPTLVRVAVLVFTEAVFNIYPPRATAALALLVGNLALLSGLWERPQQRAVDIYVHSDKRD